MVVELGGDGEVVSNLQTVVWFTLSKLIYIQPHTCIFTMVSNNEQ